MARKLREQLPHGHMLDQFYHLTKEVLMAMLKGGANTANATNVVNQAMAIAEAFMVEMAPPPEPAPPANPTPPV